MAAAFLASDSQGQHLGHLVAGAGRVKQRFQFLLALMECAGMGRSGKEQRQKEKHGSDQALARFCICGIVLLHNITCLEEQLCGSLLQRKNLLMMLR